VAALSRFPDAVHRVRTRTRGHSTSDVSGL
jgi:hypothetical protein